MANLFISSPMSAMPDFDYNYVRSQVLALIDFLHDSFCQLDIYYSGELIESTVSFDNPVQSFKNDVNALDACSGFLLVYPEKIATSALVELGYALARKVPIILITKNKSILPYMIRELDKSLENALIIEYENKSLIDYLNLKGEKLKQFLKGQLNI